MFADLIRRMTAPAPQPLSDPDARLALGALLVRIARTDGRYDPSEKAQIDQTLMSRYDLDEAEAATLRADCERLESEAPDTVRFTRALKEGVALEDRADVVEALWSVALADKTRDDAEDQLLRLVANLLGLSDKDSALARQRAAKA